MNKVSSLLSGRFSLADFLPTSVVGTTCTVVIHIYQDFKGEVTWSSHQLFRPATKYSVLIHHKT